MKTLSRDDILSCVDLAIELVEVPEWGGSVYVRSLSGAERDRYEQSLMEWRGKGKNRTAEANLSNARAKLCARTICDENGDRLFSDRDIEQLGEKSAAALDRIWEAARRLSGLSDSDIEELTEGLETGPNGGSGSA